MIYKTRIRIPVKNSAGQTVIDESLVTTIIDQIKSSNTVESVDWEEGDCVVTIVVDDGVETTTLFAARDVITGKLRSDLTNPRRKYWDRRGNAESAVRYFNSSKIKYMPSSKRGPVEVVEFLLVEKK